MDEFLQAFKPMNSTFESGLSGSTSFGGAMLAVFLVPVSHFMLFNQLFWFYLCVFFVYAINLTILLPLTKELASRMNFWIRPI